MPDELIFNFLDFGMYLTEDNLKEVPETFRKLGKSSLLIYLAVMTSIEAQYYIVPWPIHLLQQPSTILNDLPNVINLSEEGTAIQVSNEAEVRGFIFYRAVFPTDTSWFFVMTPDTASQTNPEFDNDPPF